MRVNALSQLELSRYRFYFNNSVDSINIKKLLSHDVRIDILHKFKVFLAAASGSDADSNSLLPHVF
jgi:hypothetical protein